MVRFEILLFIWLVGVFGGPVLSEGKDTSQKHQDVTESPDDPNMLQCPNTTIEGKVGDRVILPCSTKNKMDISYDTIQWLVKDPATGEYKHVHTYHQRKDQLHKQRDDFKNRTSLFKEKLSSGNCSLNLTVTTSHSGKYQCRVVIDGKPHDCRVILEVNPKGKDDTPPEKIYNNTDALKVVLGVGIPVIIVIIVIIALVYCYRERLKNCCPQGQPNNSKNAAAQQPPIKMKRTDQRTKTKMKHRARCFTRTRTIQRMATEAGTSAIPLRFEVKH